MPPKSLHVLAVDDQEFDAEALRRHLSRIPGLQLEFRHCLDGEEALSILAESEIDLVFLDYQLEGAETGLDLVKAIRETGDIRPIVILTGQGDEYLAAEITRCGADDYIVKSDLDPDLVRRAMDNANAQYRGRLAEQELARRHREIERLSHELAEANVQLAELTRLDCLTNLLNRGAWEKAMEVEHKRSIRSGLIYAVLLIDVDHFKLFNDTQGHQAGDGCLRAVARCLADTARSTDFVGRYGGEEFVILCPDGDLDNARALAERIRTSLRELDLAHPASPTAALVTASFGIAAGPAGGAWEDVVKEADDALYAAKRSGRDCVHPAEAPVPASG